MWYNTVCNNTNQYRNETKMATWQITIRGNGIRKASVEKLAKSLKDQFGEDAGISVRDATPPASRADRYSAAQGCISEGRSEMESLRDELQDWYDNLPESFQGGEKGDALQTAISELEDAIGEAESAEGHDVEFPGMY